MTEEVSFYRDTLGSYMVIRCPEGTLGEGYQYRMLAANHIDGLLECSFRNIDADSFLYYNITSRRRLSALFEAKKISASDLQHILQDTINVRQSLADFLLDSSRLLMDPDFIFCDLRDGSCAFTYYPESVGDGGVLPLLQFMENHVDERDSEAVSALYRLLSMAGGEGFFLNNEMMDSVFGKRNAVPCDADRKTEAVYEQPVQEQEIQDEEPEAPVCTENEEHAEKKWSGRAVLYRIAGIVCIAAGILLYGIWDLYPEYIVSDQADTLCRAGMFLFPAAGIVILVAGRIRRKRPSVSAAGIGGIGRKGKQNTPEDLPQPCIYPSESEYPEAFQMGGGQDNRADRRHEYTPYCEQTVVLGCTENQKGKLYGTGKASGMQISLDRLPCTIGKMREYVNVVLTDNSVSRIHASVSAGEDGQIYIRDLGSTNGTVVNGIGLRPEESAPIRPGDEIQIGALCFVYR